MRIALLSIFLLCLFGESRGQKAVAHLDLFANFYYLPSLEFPPKTVFPPEKTDAGYRNVSPAIRFSKRPDRFHTIELSSLQPGKTFQEPGIERTITSFSLRYGYFFQLGEFKNEKWQFFLGPSVKFHYGREQVEVTSPNIFPTEMVKRGLLFQASPRIHYQVHPRITLVAELPMHFFNYSFTTRRFENPAFPNPQAAEDTSFEIDALTADYMIKIGAGWRMGKKGE